MSGTPDRKRLGGGRNIATQSVKGILLRGEGVVLKVLSGNVGWKAGVETRGTRGRGMLCGDEGS